jgi:two-component system response regulator AtoC
MSRAHQILVVEPDASFRAWLKTSLAAQGLACLEAARCDEAARISEGEEFDLALIALRLPDGDGLELLKTLLTSRPGLPVIVITAYSSVSSAVEAMKRGAFDYLPKPFSADQLLLVLEKAIDTRGLRREMDRITQENLSRYGLEAIIGQSRAIEVLRDQVRKLADSPAATILLQGESGTGKDLVAKALHYSSSRANRPFVAINCSAIPDTLLEAELFGHEKGAFTDARSMKAGLIELAADGTLFLDEVAELPLPLQAKLLRFLEDRTFKRIGGTRDIVVDARVIAATNVDLAQAVAAGRFRQDLFYRLRVVPIRVPALRERREDIPLLVRHFIDYFNKKFRKRFSGITKEALDILFDHAWPGNVRELRNVVERVMLLETGPEIRADILMVPEGPHPEPVSPAAAPEAGPEDLSLRRLELQALLRALERTNGNQSGAARLLGVSRDTVRYRIQQYGVKVQTRVTAAELGTEGSGPVTGNGPG